MNAAAKGYKAILIMPDNMSKERINLLKAYGAEVVLTPAEQKNARSNCEGVRTAKQIPNSFIPQQFENPANPNIHRYTTALEIYEQMDGELDALLQRQEQAERLQGLVKR